MPTITLSGCVYDTVLTLAGETLVITQQSARMWREAKPDDARRVLAGFRAPVLVERAS